MTLEELIKVKAHCEATYDLQSIGLAINDINLMLKLRIN